RARQRREADRVHEGHQQLPGPRWPGEGLRQREAGLHHEAGRRVHRKVRVFFERAFGELSLHVRQLAWLHAVPKAPSQAVNRKGDERSRLKRILDEKQEPRLPGTAFSCVVEMLLEVGPAMDTPMGRATLSFSEIDAWARRTARSLQPWEAQFLKRLSSEYLAQFSISSDPNCPPPWRVLSAPSKDELDRKIDALL